VRLLFAGAGRASGAARGLHLQTTPAEPGGPGPDSSMTLPRASVTAPGAAGAD